jgi:predicted RNase H-like HicB family nuclease
MKSYVFQVVVEEDVQEDGSKAFHGYCPALAGCHTWGNTADEALAKVQEAVSLYVEDLIESGESIPTGPSRGATEYASPSVVVNV